MRIMEDLYEIVSSKTLIVLRYLDLKRITNSAILCGCACYYLLKPTKVQQSPIVGQVCLRHERMF